MSAFGKNLFGSALCTVMSALTALGLAFAQPGTARVDVDGNVAYLRGELGEATPDLMVGLFTKHPNIQRIVMEYVPGSEDDDSNVKASRYIHQKQVTTYVPAHGLIASGGVDFFLAGKERIVEEGACVGIHSWSEDDDPTPPAQLPRDHEGHKVFLDYYRSIGIDTEFYWYTLKVAPADGMYYMNTQELLHYKVATKVLSPANSNGGDSAPCEYR